MCDIYEIYDELITVGESITAIETAFSVLKEYYNVDDNTEIFHWLVVFQGSMKSVSDEMNKALSEMDRYMLKNKK